jgi:hypothetical protein
MDYMEFLVSAIENLYRQGRSVLATFGVGLRAGSFGRRIASFPSAWASRIAALRSRTICLVASATGAGHAVPHQPRAERGE